MAENLLSTIDIEASVYGADTEDSGIHIGCGPCEVMELPPMILWTSYDTGKRYRVLVGVKKERGEFISYCLTLPGAISCGDTVEEAIENLREAVVGCILSYRDAGQEIPWTDASGSKDEYNSTEWIAVNV